MSTKTKRLIQSKSEESGPASDTGAAQGRHAAISLAAYFRAEARGFAPGHEFEDWLAAEEDVAGSGVIE
jgi:hypothetical protein